MKRFARFTIALLLTASLYACSIPADPGTGPATLIPITPTILPAITSTQAVAVAASPTPRATIRPAASASPTIPASPTPVPPSPTPVCDRASPGNPIDLTVPDDTDMLPGQRFSKTWRLLNSGACTWTRDYSVVWWSGETFSAPVQMRFSNPVLPGRGVDITADMIAPEKTGSYQSTWKLQNASGVVFGIGPSGDAPFWVRIRVVEPEPPTPTVMVPSPTVAVFSGGLANLTPGSSLDIDSNQVNTGASDDLIYQAGSDSTHQLELLNGAQAGPWGSTAPQIANCESAALSAAAFALDAVQPGTYFCYRTSQGLPGWLRLVFLNPQDGVLSLEILTWSVP